MSLGIHWQITRGTKQYGPFTAEQMQTMAAKGSLLPNDLVRAVGAAAWVPARQCKELFAMAKPAVVNVPSRQSSRTNLIGAKEFLFREHQLPDYLATAAVAGVVFFCAGLFTARNFIADAKPRSTAKTTGEKKASAAGFDQELADHIRQHRAAPRFEEAQPLAEMPKELQGQWVDVLLSGDQGDTCTKPKCKEHPEFMMFKTRYCLGSSELTDPDHLSGYTHLWRLPDSDGEATWAVEPAEGIRFVVHRTKTVANYVLRVFEGEGALAKPTWRSIVEIRPHTDKAKRFVAGVGKSADTASVVSHSPSISDNEGAKSAATVRPTPKKRADADARNFVWGDSLDAVHDTAVETLQESEGIGGRERQLFGHVEIGEEKMSVTYKFFANKLVAVSFGSYFNDGIKGNDHPASWSPYLDMSRMGLLIHEKYGMWTEQKAHKDGRKLGLLHRDDWDTYMPSGPTEAFEIWDLPRHTITLTGTRRQVPSSDFRACVLDYESKSSASAEYKKYLAEHRDEKDRRDRIQRLRQAESL